MANSNAREQLEALWGICGELKSIREMLEIALPNIITNQLNQTSLLQQISDDLAPVIQTPTIITFQETTMLPPVAGNTLVFTGTLTPAGSAFPAGTTFTVASDDPNVTASVDSTGLIVTAVLGPNFAAGEADIITWTTSTFTPEPSTSPASLTATIDITGQAPPTPTPTAVTFVQTT